MRPGIPGAGDRLRGAIGAILVQCLLGVLLLGGLAVKGGPADTPAMRVLDFALSPPPAIEPEAKPARHRRPEGAAAPPNLKSRATDVTSPVIAPIPFPIIVAPKAASGDEASSGNAAVAGPGTGAGGVGDGTGSGGAGNGDGDGDGDTPLEWIGGRITNADYPRAALKAGVSGTVYLRFTVGVKGRVTDCIVTRSSGNMDLDETTCRLIQQRFRYRPSLDANGRPYADVVTGEHEWMLWRRPQPDDSDD